MPLGKCKLCLQVKELQNSHLLPASLFRKSRSSGANPNPMFVSEKGAVQTSRQLKNHVLCRDCEQLFSRNSENYVMTQVFDGRTKAFPLLEALQASPATWIKREWIGYALSTTPGIDRKKLGYFALSVFWRASIHTWRLPGEKPITINLGRRYNESFRRYLLGQTTFPENVALLVIACSDSLSQDSFWVPSLGDKSIDRTYSFMAKGLNFLMIIGKEMRAPAVRQLCAVTGAQGLILSRSCEAKALEAFHRLMRLSGVV